MDDLSAQYLLMANGTQSQLHDPKAVVNFVDQMQLVLERSSAPRKNFLLDTTTPRGDVIVTEASAMKPGNGWITMQVTEGIRRGVHEWCVKVEHQGETTDGSGLMLGIVPKSFSKYDSFISQGGGWCLSRAGKFYGHWRRQDTNANIVFGTGDRVTFLLDYEAARMTVRVGDKSVVGEISNLSPEVYPAVSLHYRHQFVRFEYHKLHDRHAKKLNWIERLAFPHASVYLPLTVEQLERVPLDAYVFSPVFADSDAFNQQQQQRRRKGSNGSGSFGRRGDGAQQQKQPRQQQQHPQEYDSRRAASARMAVMLRTIQVVCRCCCGDLAPTDTFLDRSVTAESLRKQLHTLVCRGGPSGVDAAVNCGALVLIHMFAHAGTTTSEAVILPLVRNLQDYLRGTALFSFAEASSSPLPAGTGLAPEVVRLAVDNVAAMVDRATASALGNENINGSDTIRRTSNAWEGLAVALAELLLLLSLHSGAVSEVLRAARYLMRGSATGVSPATVAWLRANEAALAPRNRLPNLHEALDSTEEEMEQLTPFGFDFDLAVLTVGYDHGFVYVHTSEALGKWGVVGDAYALACRTSEPRDCCVNCTRSSIAFCEAGLLLLTNRMVAAGTAVVIYNSALEIRRVISLSETPQWPLGSRCMSIASGPGDRIILLYESHSIALTTPTPAGTPLVPGVTITQPTTTTTTTTTAAAAAAAAATAVTTTGTAGTGGGIEVQVFYGSSFPRLERTLTLRTAPLDRTLDYCLTLRKGSMIDFGSPDGYLATVGGHVTVEVWVKILERNEAAVFYQHGDRSTSGEVFLETARLEGAWRIRGGYRHDARGMCVVSAPVNPAFEPRFLHIVLVFDGNWRLYFDGEEVSRTKQGPQVSLEHPRQRWTAGNDCVCQMAGLRLWKGARSSREIVRDSRRLLIGDDPGLLCQYLFNEQNGNVAYNHVIGTGSGRCAIVCGLFIHAPCLDHPLHPSLGGSSVLKRTTATAATATTTTAATTTTTTTNSTPDGLIGGIPQLHNTHVFMTAHYVGLVSHSERPIAGFTDLKNVHRARFFHTKTGVGVPGGFVLRQRSKMGLIGCDCAGHYWELFRSEQNAGNISENVRTPFVAVGKLSVSVPSLQERFDATTVFYRTPMDRVPVGNDSSSSTCSASSRALIAKTGGSATNSSGRVSSAGVGNAKGTQEADIHKAPVTFGSVALWLFDLLSTFAETTSTVTDHRLFSPLVDDVSVRCVQEVQLLLCEHCRVVKAMNSRRTASLRDSTSATIIATALRVLIRIVRRVRDFRLHPDTIGLSEVRGSRGGGGGGDDDLRGVLSEIRRRGSQARQDDAVPGRRVGMLDAAQSCGTLLGVLTDIVDEAGLILPAELAVLARTILQEGVTLFFPSAAVRARLLREILERDEQSSARSPSLHMLLDAIVKSFTDIHSAAALVRAVDPSISAESGKKGQDKDEITGEEKHSQSARLRVIHATLSTLLAESLRQILTPPSLQHSDVHQRRQHLALLTAMADATGTLQLLLLSQSGAGTGATSDVITIPFHSSAPLNGALRGYYAELFDAAETAFKALARRVSSGPGSGSSVAAALFALDTVGASFLGAPLHAAVTALQLVAAREAAEWMLDRLNTLRRHFAVLLEQLRREAPAEVAETDRWPVAVLDHALLLSASAVASFMALGELPDGNNRDHNNKNNNNNNNNSYSQEIIANGSSGAAELQEICDHPLLSGGPREAAANKKDTMIGVLMSDRAVWEGKARRTDIIAAQVPPELSTVIATAAIAVVHLTGRAKIRLKNNCTNEGGNANGRRKKVPMNANKDENEKESVQELLTTTLLRLRGARNELLSRRSKCPADFAQVVREAQERCDALLTMRPVTDAEHSSLSSLFLAHSFVDQCERDEKPDRAKGARWRRVRRLLRARQMYHAALVHGASGHSLTSAISLVERVLLSPYFTAAGFRAELTAREASARRRLEGLRHLLSLIERDTVSASRVASLFFGGAVGGRTPFESGVSGCTDGMRVALRGAMYDVLRELSDATPVIAAAESERPDGAFHPATLSEVLRRRWLPGDFCFLQHMGAARVVFHAFCSIFDRMDTASLRRESATDRAHRFAAKVALKQSAALSGGAASLAAGEPGGGSGGGSGSGGPGHSAGGDAPLQRTPREAALVESLLTLKTLSVQCAQAMGDAAVAPNERRGCALFLDQMLDALEGEVCRCTQYAGQIYTPDQDRVLEQVSLLCTLASTIARALPPGFLCGPQSCVSYGRLARQLCTLARILTAAGPAAGSNTIDMCIYTAALLLRHCQPVTADPLFVEELENWNKNYMNNSSVGSATLCFFFEFAVRCILSAGLNETGLRCIDALHMLLSARPWDTPFCGLRDAFLRDLTVATCTGAPTSAGANASNTAAAAAAEKKEKEDGARRSTDVRLLVWAYALGGVPAGPLALGRKVLMCVDDTLATTEEAYIVDIQPNGVACVQSAAAATLTEEREVPLDALVNASQREVQLPRADVLFCFLLPALEHIFARPQQAQTISSSPLQWAATVAFLRATHAVLRDNPMASRVLLERDILSHVHKFAGRVHARSPLPLFYLQEVCPVALQHVLRSPRLLPFDAVVPSMSVKSQDPSPGNSSLHRMMTFGAVTPLSPEVPPRGSGQRTMEGRTTGTGTTTTIAATAGDLGGVLSSLARLPPAHSSLSLTPSILCFSGGRNAPSGTLTLCPIAGGKRVSSFPAWTNGVTVEASVLLYDRLFPELGEDFVIPSSWQRPEVYFTLFSVHDRAGIDVPPLLRVVLTDDCIECFIDGAKGSESAMSAKLLREDWDHWIHIAVVIEGKTITLYKDGSATTAVLPKTLCAQLEASLRDRGGIGSVVIGNSPHVLGSERESKAETMIVAVDSVRIWGSTRPLKAQRATADFVSREQTLPIIASADTGYCTFRFAEATGGETVAENKDGIGILRGFVRWTPFPVFSGTLSLDKSPRPDPTLSAELPIFIPRKEFESFFTSLDITQLMRIGGDYILSLCAHLSRQCVVAAICQLVSPEYRVLVIERQVVNETTKKNSTDSAADNNASSVSLSSGSPFSSSAAVPGVIDPRRIIEGADIIRHLVNVLRYSDTGSVSIDTMKAVSEFVRQWFYTISNERDLQIGFCEASFAISEALHDETETFCVELPPLSYVTTDIHLVPIAILNGPGGSISFDASSRGIEHMTLLRDRKQKSLLAKYPDAQGGWPELEIPNDDYWFYARPIISTRSSIPSFTVSARSLKPFVACSLFGALRDVLTSGDARYQCGLSYFLNTPFMSLLTTRAGASRFAAVPACRILTALMELWCRVPHFSPHDQSPLKIMLAHLNAPLMTILHRGQISPTSPPLLLPTLGHYNLTVQSAFELLVAAIRLEAAWRGVSHNICTRLRWRRLFSLWEHSITYGSPIRDAPHEPLPERGYVKLIELPLTRSSPPQGLHHSKSRMLSRGNGTWYACCERGFLSARSNIGFGRGRFYFEVRIPSSGEAISVGIVTERAQQESELTPRGLGHDGESWGFDSGQMCRFHHGFRHEFTVRSKWKGNDVVGILLDLEAGTLACIHDERQVSFFDNIKTSRTNGVTSSFFPAVSFGSGGIEVNFGAAPFACSLPSGYLPVDPANYMTSPSSKVWALLAAVNLGESIAAGDIPTTIVSKSVPARISTPLSLPTFFEDANAAAMLYDTGRNGPFNVSLLPCDGRTKMSTLHGNEVRAEDDPCFVRGTVSVKSGRWYYEVVLRGDALVSIGWITATATADWSRCKALGDDADSWVLEGSRTTARHNKHQRSIGGQMWKHGDVVGCMVDCDVGTIAYSVNGVPLRDIHDTKGEGVLFTSVKCVNGLMPVVGVDPKNAAAIAFCDDELAFLPVGYRALGTSSPIRVSLERYYCTAWDADGVSDSNKCSTIRSDLTPSGYPRGNSSITDPNGRSDHSNSDTNGRGVKFSALLARRLLSSLTALTELNFINPSTYCIEGVLDRNINTVLCERFKGRDNARELLVTLKNLTALAECLIPYAHTALFPGNYDVFLSGPMCRALRHCVDFMLPALALRMLHGFVSNTNSPGENVKLTVNRRKALSIVKDMNLSVTDRLRGSLFGQVHQLLHDKNISFFCTSKKLWSVSFVGEGADDIGGPYRESITQLCSELMSSGLPLFIPSANQVGDIGESREVFVVRPKIEPPLRQTMYHFFGRLIAGCLRSAEPLPIYLPSRIWKAFIGVHSDESDLGMVDKAALQSYQYIYQRQQDNSVTDEELSELCPGGFSVLDDMGTEHELFPGGSSIAVGRHNAHLFVKLALHFRLCRLGAAQIKALADGFHQVVPVSAVSLLKWYELEQIVCGQPDYDADTLLDAARYEDLDPSDSRVVFLREVLRQFSRHERGLFMRFVSGRERLPSGVRLKLMPDTYTRTTRDDGVAAGDNTFDDNRLPHASTCFYWLSIPNYSSVEVMRQKLLFAIQQCMDIDADFVVHERGTLEEETEPTLAVNLEEDEEDFEDFSHLR